MPYTILVADDETAVRTMLEVILSADGHNVVTVSDGKAALEYLKTSTPDAMLLDVRMPFLDGYEICSRVKRIARLARVPVMLLTAFDDASTHDQAKLAGADDVIFKPLSGKNLRGRVTQLIEASRAS